MDGKRPGWQVCNDNVEKIRAAVAEDLKKFGHLSRPLVVSLRGLARVDDDFHSLTHWEGIGYRRIVKPKEKKG